MLQYDLVIIGGGASGLSAGVEALKNGIKKVLILERGSDLGGNLNLFIHNGFGEHYLNKIITAPEFASELIKDYKTLGGEFKVDSEVLSLTKERVITFVNPSEGVKDVTGKAIILASGCREKFTGNIMVPVNKYTGVFTLVAAHRLVNLKGYLPGKKVVMVGKSKWSLLVARRLIIEGAKVEALIDISYDRTLSEEELEIISGFDINIINDSEVIELIGSEKIEIVKIRNNKNGEILDIECDSLILKVGYYPEVNYIKDGCIKLSEEKSPYVIDYQTTLQGVYACGTILNRELGVSYSAKEGNLVGNIVAQYIKKGM